MQGSPGATMWRTEKCRFMDKRVREISRFFVALRLEFTPAVWRVSRTLLSRNTSGSVHTTLLASPKIYAANVPGLRNAWMSCSALYLAIHHRVKRNAQPVLFGEDLGLGV